MKAFSDIQSIKFKFYFVICSEIFFHVMFTMSIPDANALSMQTDLHNFIDRVYDSS